jgi:hypothetical protein
MSPEATNPARNGVAAGLGNGHLLGGDDGFRDSLLPVKKQPFSDVERARADLLRAFVIEALSIAAHYNGTAITFAQIGDDACLEMSIREFARTASIATRTARELIDLRRSGGAS